MPREDSLHNANDQDMGGPKKQNKRKQTLPKVFNVHVYIWLNYSTPGSILQSWQSLIQGDFLTTPRPLFSTKIKKGQRVKQRLSQMKDFMEDELWLWLAPWHFYFGTEEGREGGDQLKNRPVT